MYQFWHSCAAHEVGKIENDGSVSHFDLIVLFTVAGYIHFGGILFAICQCLTRAVGALVIQEEEKTRNLFRS
jgi:hypothetical protein